MWNLFVLTHFPKILLISFWKCSSTSPTAPVSIFSDTNICRSFFIRIGIAAIPLYVALKQHLHLLNSPDSLKSESWGFLIYSLLNRLKVETVQELELQVPLLTLSSL